MKIATGFAKKKCMPVAFLSSSLYEMSCTIFLKGGKRERCKWKEGGFFGKRGENRKQNLMRNCL